MSAPDLSGIAGNFFTAAQRGYSNSLNGAITNVAVTATLNSLAGFTTGDSVFLWIEPSSSNAELVYGIVNTATNQLTSMVRGIIGSAAAHANGATVSQYVSSADHQAMRKGILVQHNQDGTHKAITTPSVTTTGAVTAGSGLAMSAGAFTPTGSWDGWVGSGESWTFNSSTAITVPTDATTKYDVGDFVKITQSATVKYFVVTAVTSTKLTVGGLNGVTVANSAISAPAYSKTATPHGVGPLYQGNPFGPWAAWTPTITAQAGTITTSVGVGRFKQLGKTVFFYSNLQISNIGSGSGSVIFTLPMAASANVTNQNTIGSGREGALNGNTLTCMISDSTHGDVRYNANGNPMVNGVSLFIHGCYEVD